MTNFPYQRPSTGLSLPNVGLPSGQASSVQPPPFSTQRSTYLPPSDRSTYRPSSYNPRPTITTSYPNSASSAFPPYSTTPRPIPTAQPVYSTSGAVSTNYDYSSSSFGGSTATGKFSTPSGFSTNYGYPSQRPSSTYVPSAEEPVTVPSSTGYSYPTAEPGANPYDRGVSTGYPPAPGYPSAIPDRTFPAQDAGSSGSGATATDTGAGSIGEGRTRDRVTAGRSRSSFVQCY